MPKARRNKKIAAAKGTTLMAANSNSKVFKRMIKKRSNNKQTDPKRYFTRLQAKVMSKIGGSDNWSNSGFVNANNKSARALNVDIKQNSKIRASSTAPAVGSKSKVPTFLECNQQLEPFDISTYFLNEGIELALFDIKEEEASTLNLFKDESSKTDDLETSVPDERLKLENGEAEEGLTLNSDPCGLQPQTFIVNADDFLKFANAAGRFEVLPSANSSTTSFAFQATDSIQVPPTSAVSTLQSSLSKYNNTLKKYNAFVNAFENWQGFLTDSRNTRVCQLFNEMKTHFDDLQKKEIKSIMHT